MKIFNKIFEAIWGLVAVILFVIASIPSLVGTDQEWKSRWTVVTFWISVFLVTFVVVIWPNVFTSTKIVVSITSFMLFVTFQIYKAHRAQQMYRDW